MTEEAGSINARGDIVGAFRDMAGKTHGFLRRNGQFTTLDFPSAISTFAGSINSRGQITGAYRDLTGRFHGFLATPEHGN